MSIEKEVGPKMIIGKDRLRIETNKGVSFIPLVHCDALMKTFPRPNHTYLKYLGLESAFIYALASTKAWADFKV